MVGTSISVYVQTAHTYCIQKRNREIPVVICNSANIQIVVYSIKYGKMIIIIQRKLCKLPRINIFA